MKTSVFHNWSGGLESSAMLVIDRERIRETGSCVRWADTGKHFPEMQQSKQEIETALGLSIVTVPRRITFDEFLFERGGMIRKGTTDCSRRMKRSNLKRHLADFPKPWEINLGFNVDEEKRAAAFSERNGRDWCKWRYPLIEHGIDRDETWSICRKAGFKTLVAMYEKMGRFDCFWCGNQTAKQAKLVLKHYPHLADEWKAAEARKGHSFRPVSLQVLEDETAACGDLLAGCSCFGGDDDVWDDEPA